MRRIFKDSYYESKHDGFYTIKYLMIMILNDVLTKQNVFTKIILKDGDKELSKELKEAS